MRWRSPNAIRFGVRLIFRGIRDSGICESKRVAMTPAELRTLRERLGLSQGELAKHLGIDRNSVWRKEHGQRAITERDVIMLRQIEKDGAS
jgi:DNA-binding transcriptional regulator YiaG